MTFAFFSVIAAQAGGVLRLSLRGVSQTCTLTWAGYTRQYILYIPVNFAPTQGIVVALHGNPSSAKAMESADGLDATADKGGFAVAYPQSLSIDGTSAGNRWGILGAISLWTSQGLTPPDDSGFIRQLILTLQTRGCMPIRRGCISPGFHRAPSWRIKRAKSNPM